jgi:hypothetical protein
LVQGIVVGRGFYTPAFFFLPPKLLNFRDPLRRKPSVQEATSRQFEG